jgi:hypothetical protein
MRRNLYVRITQYESPVNTTVARLHLLVLVSRPTHIIEGVLLSDVRVRESIRIQAVCRDGKACRGKVASSPVLRIEGQYALTESSFYQFAKVPPFKRDRSRAA